MIKDPPTFTVDVLTVILELHVFVETDVPQSHVFELILRQRPCLNPVRTAERYAQTRQGENAAPETDPSYFAGRRRLLFRDAASFLHFNYFNATR
jgi:hypothetical protein